MSFKKSSSTVLLIAIISFAYGNKKLCGNNKHKSSIKTICSSLLDTTIAIGDTLRLNDTTFVLQRTFKRYDTIFSAITIDGIEIPKKSTFIEYDIRPYDTIIVPKALQMDLARKEVNPAKKDAFKVNTESSIVGCDECEAEAQYIESLIAKSKAENVIIDIIGNTVIKGKRKHNSLGSKKGSSSTTLKIIQPKNSLRAKAGSGRSIPSNRKWSIASTEKNKYYTTNKVLDLPGSKHLKSRTLNRSQAYQITLQEIEKKRQHFAALLKVANNSSTRNKIIKDAAFYLEQAIGSDIIYYWYGVKFKSGKTILDTPHGTSIKANNFIVTILQEADVQVNVKGHLLNNQTVVKSLSAAKLPKKFKQAQNVESYVRDKGLGLYVVAYATNQEAFLFNDGHQIHLIRIAPSPTFAITRTSCQKATDFASAKRFEIGKIADNTELVRKWLQGQTIKISP